MKFQFKPDSEATVIDVQNGDYSRRFERSAEPFDVTEKEARLLRDVDDLQPLPEVPATENEEQSQADGKTKLESDGQNSEGDASASEAERQSEESSAETNTSKSPRRSTRSSQPAK